MSFTYIIGLEVHVQLLTRSKLFCGCANRFNPDQPNTQTCPVCLGLPGSLPAMNREAFRLALKTGLALNCGIAEFTKWDRKQYYYPDLPKNYQVSQYDLPFAEDGYLEIDSADGERKRIGIIRVHMEEDAGKNLHDESGRGQDSRVDLNRTGTPLLEIVSHPDLTSPQDAKTYLEELKLLLTYLEVSDCNMQEGSLRCDANVNIRIDSGDGRRIVTPIVEVKNLNSFRGVEQAIEHEGQRQLEEWRRTGLTLGDPGAFKTTRGWDADRGVTFAQRSKEEVADYRYFPDPDLVPVAVGRAELDALRESAPELPAARRDRFKVSYELSQYDAGVIIDRGASFADYFEAVAQGCGDGKVAANWVTQDILREMNERHLAIGDFPVSAETLGALLGKIKAGQLTTKGAREVFERLLDDTETSRDSGAAESSTLTTVGRSLDLRWRVDAIIEEQGLAVVSDAGQLDGVIDAVLARNEKAVADLRAGRQQAIGKLIGEVMREVKGADAKVVRETILRRVGS